MQSKSTLAAVLLAAATPLVNAMGNAVIKNQCHFPLYLWTVSNFPGEMKTIDVGESYTENYLINPDGGGISMKIATNPTNAGAITQYEYTVTGSDLWYDISNINGAPFTKWGFDLSTSDPSCRNVVCASGVEQCDQVYNTPDQNEATAHCFANSDTVVTLCSSHKGHANTDTNVDVVAKKHHNKHHNKHHHHNKGGDAPAPAPPAPVPTTSLSSVVQPSVSVGAYGPSTTFFTQVITQVVTARAAEPTLQARHVHEHGHAHAHHRS